MRSAGDSSDRGPTRRRWGPRALVRVVWPFVVILPVTLALAWWSMEILSASRAYIAAESLWSKSQKDAVFDLLRYAQTRDEVDYVAFRESLRVPLGDRRAREELLKPNPDLDVARTGLRAAAAHEDDVERMIWLLRQFRDAPFMRRGLRIWADADALIDELEAAGMRMHARVAGDALIATGRDDSAEVEALVEQVRTINERLRPLEDAFSDNLGDAYRSVQIVLFCMVAGTALLLLSFAWGATRRLQGRALRAEGELRASEREAMAERERAAVTLRSIGDGVVTVDANGVIEYLNPVAELLTGWRDEEARGRLFAEAVRIVYEDRRVEVPDPVAAVIAEGKPLRLRHPAVLVRRDGKEIGISESSAPILSPDGRPTGVVVVLRDVSRERRLAAQLSWQASHDALTGLMNRREFERRLETALGAVAEEGRQHTLLYVDLDQFKVVNDTCGHAAGDELIRQVAELMSGQVRERDTLARLGGDEFAVLLENCPLPAALRIAEEMRRRVDEIRFVREGRTFTIGASIGLIPLDACPRTVHEAIAAADRACYAAKDGGRNRVAVHDATDIGTLAPSTELQWIARVRSALDDDRFELHCQRIAPLREGDDDPLRIEAFVRMRDESGELVAPGLFLPAAERYGWMPRIDRWVIGDAMRQLGALRAAGAALPVCVVKLGAPTLADAGLVRYIDDQFRRQHVPYANVCFELTEAAVVANLIQSRKVMHEIQSLGCSLSLDDFGAGMSSFGYLRTLPVDYVKVDGALVRNLDTDPVDAATVESINKVGHALGKRTIADMVERPEMREMLRRIGFDYMQGYAAGPILPLEEVLAERRAALAVEESGSI